MDAGDFSSATNSVSGQNASRKERGAIAAQACETCRNRKQKCDEQRPKCGTCQRFKLECRYREPQPIKKDKTLVEILDRLRSVESKIDGFSLKNSFASAAYGAPHPSSAYIGATPLVVEGDAHDSLPASSVAPGSPTATHNGSQYRYTSSSSRLLEWPAIRRHFESLGQKLQSSPNEHGGLPLPVGLHDSTTSLPLEGLQSTDMAADAPRFPLHFAGSRTALEMNTPTIGWDTVQQLVKSYFDTFNFLHPIMDLQWFNSNTFSSIINTGFQEGTTSTLVLLVLALGEMAQTTSGVPISVYKGRPSGIKGGTMDRPPGLAYFNEARKRMGFALTEISLEAVQMFALAAIYLDSSGQAIESWRMSVFASLACQGLITRFDALNYGPTVEFNVDLMDAANLVKFTGLEPILFVEYTGTVRILKRSYLLTEFELSPTGLEKLDDTMGLPDFSGPIAHEDYIGNQTTLSQEHYASQIVLQRLTANFHTTLGGAFGSTTPSPLFPSLSACIFNGSSGDCSPSTIKHLSAQLEQWRGMLPGHLRWHHDQPMAFLENSQDGYNSVYSTQELHINFVLTPDLDRAPANYPCAADIHVALLRSRYYYNKYLIYRPFIFKSLHYPETLTREDAEGTAECLKAMIKWPIAMSPPCANKRLIPSAFFWSRNMFGILVLLHVSQHHPTLLRIRSNFCGEGFDVDATETVELYLDWIRDMKNVDSTARWCWSVIRLLYRLDD